MDVISSSQKFIPRNIFPVRQNTLSRIYLLPDCQRLKYHLCCPSAIKNNASRIINSIYLNSFRLHPFHLSRYQNKANTFFIRSNSLQTIFCQLDGVFHFRFTIPYKTKQRHWSGADSLAKIHFFLSDTFSALFSESFSLLFSTLATGSLLSPGSLVSFFSLVVSSVFSSGFLGAWPDGE